MSRLLPNWIKAYLAYTDESESPEEFHRWVALSVLAGAVRRQSFFHMGYFLVYPNLFIILVSPAGRCKKSTAMRIGRSLLEPVEGISYSSDSTTRERLIQDLSQSFKDGHSSMSAFSSEFASLLTSSGQDMIIFLTDIYDSPAEWSHRTKMGGTNKIVAPCLNLLGATTPDWMARAMPLDTIGIGLTSRTLFVYEDEPRIKDPFPVLSKEQQELFHILVQDLGQISMINGQFTLDQTAKDFYTEWYREHLSKPNITGDPRLDGYYARKHIHIIKIAMLVSASYKNDIVLVKSDIEVAMEILKYTESQMAKAFSAVGKNPLNVDIDDTLAAIMSEPKGLTFGQLLGLFKHSVRKDEMSEVIDTLIAIGHVIARPIEHEGVKYFATFSDSNLNKP